MIRIAKALTLPLPPDIYDFGAPEDILFFDIETTGLSARSAGLYLIGMLHYVLGTGSPKSLAVPSLEPLSSSTEGRKCIDTSSETAADEGHWELLQLFCEDVADEPGVLQAFFSLLSTKKVLLSYNGDGFDLPFLRHMVEQYDLPYSFDDVESVDLFKKFRPLKRLLGLENLKLKTCERFLGIDREDRFSGGELIEVYFEWQKTKDPALLHMLLLHNAEDIENLPNVLPLLRYETLLHSELELASHALLPEDTTSAGTAPVLRLSFLALPPRLSCRSMAAAEAPHTREVTMSCRLHCPTPAPIAIPKPFDAQGDFWALHAEGCHMELYVQLFEGERKLFFPDVENYYYLPAEDQVVHKSLAEFVDRNARKKACAKNCYQRVSGCFLPEYREVFTPALQEDYRGKLLYVPYHDALWEDAAKASAYGRSFLEIL